MNYITAPLLQTISPPTPDLTWLTWFVPVAVAAITLIGVLLTPVIKAQLEKRDTLIGQVKELSLLVTDLRRRVNVLEGKVTRIGEKNRKMLPYLDGNEPAKKLAMEISDIAFGDIDYPLDSPPPPRRGRRGTTKGFMVDAQEGAL